MVLPELFLLNRQEASNSKTIYQRSTGLNLRVFFNMAFHDALLEKKYRETTYETKQISTPKSSSDDQCSRKEPNCAHVRDIEKTPTNDNIDVRLINKPESVDGLYCKSNSSNVLLRSHKLDRPEPFRKDLFVETVMREFNIGVYIETVDKIEGLMNIMLPYAHPDAIVNIIPGDGELVVRSSGVFTTVQYGGMNVTRLFKEAIRIHPTSCLIWIGSGTGDDHDHVISTLHSALSVVSERDIIAIHDSHMNIKRIYECMCTKQKTWHITKRDGIFLLKSIAFDKPNVDILPSVPTLQKMSKQSLNCDKDILKTDVVIFTKERPMQLFAFLESLYKMVTGVNAVWVIQYPSELFQAGYQFVYESFANLMNIHPIQQQDGDFGNTLLSVLDSMTANYVVLAVDEIIWLSKLDLHHSSCLIEEGKDEIATFQLRLGKNLQTYNDIKEMGRFHTLNIDSDTLIFYPKRLPYDFGYVLNINGTLISKRTLLSDWSPWIRGTRQPNDLESRWIRWNLHTRCRQWHLMYSTSMLVNNALPDGRVLNRKQPNEQSLLLLSDLTKKKMKIDIESFIKDYSSPKQTHIHVPLHYITIDNN